MTSERGTMTCKSLASQTCNIVQHAAACKGPLHRQSEVVRLELNDVAGSPEANWRWSWLAPGVPVIGERLCRCLQFVVGRDSTLSVREIIRFRCYHDVDQDAVEGSRIVAPAVSLAAGACDSSS